MIVLRNRSWRERMGSKSAALMYVLILVARRLGCDLHVSGHI
jgi:hypothetical protein